MAMVLCSASADAIGVPTRIEELAVVQEGGVSVHCKMAASTWVELRSVAWKSLAYVLIVS